MFRFAKWITAAVVGMGCTLASAETRLQGAGATFPNPIYQKWISEYQKSHPEVKIDYQSIGSGGGIKGITEKTVDFAGSDAPMSKKELAAAPAPIVHIPTVAGAVVVAYNIPGFSGELKLTGEIVADIYMGRITKWNDAKIKALNEGASFPDVVITPVWRTDGSGTSFVFTNYLTTQSDAFKDSIGAGKQVKWPVGQGGKGNEGVTAVVQGTSGGFGYIELAYAIQNKIPFALMQNKNGKFVKASADTVANAGAGAVKEMDKSLAVNIWNQPGDEAYPIASFTYLLVYQDLSYLGSEKANTVIDFIRWCTHDGEKLASSLDYAPLAPAVQVKVDAVLATIKK